VGRRRGGLTPAGSKDFRQEKEGQIRQGISITRSEELISQQEERAAMRTNVSALADLILRMGAGFQGGRTALKDSLCVLVHTGNMSEQLTKDLTDFVSACRYAGPDGLDTLKAEAWELYRRILEEK
jgi:hypothetical protein